MKKETKTKVTTPSVELVRNGDTNTYKYEVKEN